MKSVAFFLCILGLSGQLLAQNNYTTFFMRQARLASDDTKITVTAKGDTALIAFFKNNDVVNNRYGEFTKLFKGTPYFMNGWYQGEIVTTTNSILQGVQMAYNIQRKTVYVAEDTTQEAVAVKIKAFTIKGHNFQLLDNTYYETIYEGSNSTLLKEYTCMLEMNQPAELNGYEVSGPQAEYEGSYVKSVKYYWLFNNERIPVPTGKRIFKIFGEKEGAMEAFAKANRLKINAESGIVALFKQYDTGL